MGQVATMLVFGTLISSQLFHCPLLPSSGGSLFPLHLLPLECYHMYMWGNWYFSWQSLSMIQRMLAIWSLGPLPFLNPACASGSSQFTCCWRMGPRWQSRRMCAHLLQELQNFNLLLNNHRQENVGSHQKRYPLQKKKIPHIQRQRSPSKMVGGVKSSLQSYPMPPRDARRVQTKPGPRQLIHQRGDRMKITITEN